MSFNNANTFSFDKVVAQEASALLYGEALLVASPVDHSLPGNSSYSAGFLEPPPFQTLVGTFDGCVTLAVCDCEMQQRTLQIDSSTNSSMVVQVMEKSIQAKPTPLYDVATADGVYEYEDSPDETSQSTPLESQDTGESSRLNFRKNVDGFEQDLQLAMIPTKIANYVPQKLYQPRGKTEQEKYVHMADLSSPIMFYTEKPTELGIALEEILEKKSRPLRDGDDLVFEGSGRSISVRIEWPGYPSWNRQLATRDYRKTPGPITKAKLAKNLAICIRKFIEQMKTHRLEADSDPTWRISHIKFEDLVLDSLVHVSQGSWQPRLGLRRQMRGGSSRT